MRKVEDEENLIGSNAAASPTTTNMCTSFSGMVPISITDFFFPSQPVKTMTDARLPPPAVEISARQSVAQNSSDYSEELPALKLKDTDSTESSDDENGTSASSSSDLDGKLVRKGSIFRSFGCILILVTLILASVGFVASVFVLYPRGGDTTSNNADGSSSSSFNSIQTNNETDEDSSSTVTFGTTMSPSPTLSPSSLETTSPTISFLPLSPTPHPTPLLESIALEAVEDTYISRDDEQQIFGKKSHIRIKGGDDTMISIIRFDITSLIERNVTIVETKLRLFALTDTSFGGQINLASNDCDWSERDTSWRNAPRCITNVDIDSSGLLDGWKGSNLLGWFGEVKDPGEWYEVTLAWQPRQIPSQLTLVLSSTDEDGITYASRDMNNSQNGNKNDKNKNGNKNDKNGNKNGKNDNKNGKNDNKNDSAVSIPPMLVVEYYKK